MRGLTLRKDKSRGELQQEDHAEKMQEICAQSMTFAPFFHKRLLTLGKLEIIINTIDICV